MKKNKMSLIVTMVLFGSIGLFVRGINFSSSQIAMARGVIGCICLIAASFLFKRPLSLKRILANKKWLIASGIAIGLNWVLLFEAYRYTSIPTATICYYFAPIFVILLSPFLLKEKLAGKKIICIIVAMLGMIIMTQNGNVASGTNELKGIFFGIMAAALYASVVIMNKFLKDISGIERTVVQLGIAALAILPYTLLTDGINYASGKVSSIILLIVVGVVHTGIAYLVYFSVMEKLTSQTIAVYSYIDPISAILMSWLILGENMSMLQMIGGALILGATFISEVNLVKNPKVETNVTK